MSLISIKNFVAPFTNTVHAVTIILATILFAIFRLQGGGVAVSYSRGADSQMIDRRQNIAPRSATEARDVENLLNNRNTSPSAPQQGSIRISPEEEDLLKQMIGNNPAPEKTDKAPVKASPDNKKSPGGLDDIEKLLGMR